MVISKIIATVIVYGLLGLMFSYCKKHERKAENVVVPGKLYLIVGIAGLAVLLIPGTVALFIDVNFFIPLSLFLISLVYGLLVVLYINYKICHSNKSIERYNLFRRKRTYLYEELSSFKVMDHNSFKLYFGKRRLTVHQFFVGGDRFLGFVKTKYAKIHDGHPLPYKR